MPSRCYPPLFFLVLFIHPCSSTACEIVTINAFEGHRTKEMGMLRFCLCYGTKVSIIPSNLWRLKDYLSSLVMWFGWWSSQRARRTHHPLFFSLVESKPPWASLQQKTPQEKSQFWDVSMTILTLQQRIVLCYTLFSTLIILDILVATTTVGFHICFYTIFTNFLIWTCSSQNSGTLAFHFLKLWFTPHHKKIL